MPSVKPIILYDNALKRAFPLESLEAKLASELLLDVYTSPSEVNLEVNLPSTEPIDSLAITMHNLSSLRLEWFDGTNYQILYEGLPKIVDFIRFDSVIGSSFRITLTPNVDNFVMVGNLFLGNSLTFDYGFSNFTPANLLFSDKVFTSTNYQNIGLSNVVQKQTRKIKVSQEYIKSEIFEEKFRKFISNVNTTHFYLDYFDICYCILDKSSTINTSIKNNLINFSFDASALTSSDFI